MKRALLLIPLVITLSACGAPTATTTPSPVAKVITTRTTASPAQTKTVNTSVAPEATITHTGGATTCQEFASLNAKTGLGVDPNAKQVTLIKQVLVEYNKDPGDQNVKAAYVKLIAWCNIYDGAAGAPNTNQPIKNLPSLKG